MSRMLFEKSIEKLRDAFREAYPYTASRLKLCGPDVYTWIKKEEYARTPQCDIWWQLLWDMNNKEELMAATISHMGERRMDEVLQEYGEPKLIKPDKLLSASNLAVASMRAKAVYRGYDDALLVVLGIPRGHERRIICVEETSRISDATWKDILQAVFSAWEEKRPHYAVPARACMCAWLTGVADAMKRNAIEAFDAAVGLYDKGKKILRADSVFVYGYGTGNALGALYSASSLAEHKMSLPKYLGRRLYTLEGAGMSFEEFIFHCLMNKELEHKKEDKLRILVENGELCRVRFTDQVVLFTPERFCRHYPPNDNPIDIF